MVTKLKELVITVHAIRNIPSINASVDINSINPLKRGVVVDCEAFSHPPQSTDTSHWKMGSNEKEVVIKK